MTIFYRNRNGPVWPEAGQQQHQPCRTALSGYLKRPARDQTTVDLNVATCLALQPNVQVQRYGDIIFLVSFELYLRYVDEN